MIERLQSRPGRNHRGVMLVGHGTRDEVGTRQFFELGERLAERLNPQPVVSCLLEFQQPTIPQAWSQLVEQGVEHIDVAPLLLFAAGHAKQDIPQIIAECRRKNPGVSVDQSRPLSRHPAIVELASRRITETIDRAPITAEQTALVMVGRGSRDPCAQADMRVLSEVISRRVNVADVWTTFYAMAQPRLSATLEKVAACGQYRDVIVYPHLLFAGRLYQAIERQVKEAHQRPDGVGFRLTHYLGPDPLVAEAIAARVGQIN